MLISIALRGYASMQILGIIGAMGRYVNGEYVYGEGDYILFIIGPNGAKVREACPTFHDAMRRAWEAAEFDATPIYIEHNGTRWEYQETFWKYGGGWDGMTEEFEDHYLRLDEPEAQDCDCDWLGELEEHDFSCGCGEAETRPYRDEVIHWKGSHWTIRCAFREALRDIRRLGRE